MKWHEVDTGVWWLEGTAGTVERRGGGVWYRGFFSGMQAFDMMEEAKEWVMARAVAARLDR